MNQIIIVKRTDNKSPVRQWDYSATMGDYDLGNAIGLGATPNEAIEDLEDLLEARS